MRRTATFEREMPGSRPAWLVFLRAMNAEAQAFGDPEPFGGRPTLTENQEDYANGGRVQFTGITGDGKVILSWEA